jgi:hypothetical protein
LRGWFQLEEFSVLLSKGGRRREKEGGEREGSGSAEKKRKKVECGRANRASKKEKNPSIFFSLSLAFVLVRSLTLFFASLFNAVSTAPSSRRHDAAKRRLRGT